MDELNPTIEGGMGAAVAAPSLDEVLGMEPSLLNIGLILKSLMQAAHAQQAQAAGGAQVLALEARLKAQEDEPCFVEAEGGGNRQARDPAAGGGGACACA